MFFIGGISSLYEVKSWPVVISELHLLDHEKLPYVLYYSFVAW